MTTALTTYSFTATNGTKVTRTITERTPGMYNITSKTNKVTRTTTRQPGGIVQMMIDSDIKTLDKITNCFESNVEVPDAEPDYIYYSTGIETNRENEVIFIVVDKKTGHAASTTFIRKVVKTVVETNEDGEDNE